MLLTVDIDDRVRNTASVLLLTKFVDENTGSREHPVRIAVRKHLEGQRDHPFAALCRRLAEDHWMSAFYCYAVLIDWQATDEMEPQDPCAQSWQRDFDRSGYGAGLRRFAVESHLPALWERTAEAWAEVVADCEGLLAEAEIESFLTRLYGETDLRLVLLPNPLDPPTFGFGPRVGESAYSIVGPPQVRDGAVTYRSYGPQLANLAFHEFSHSLWSDCMKSLPSLADDTAFLADGMELKSWFPRMYPTWPEQLDELVIRASTALYVRERRGDAEARSLLEKEKTEFGLTRIDRVYRCLKEYLGARERGEYEGLRDYLPMLTKDLARWTSA